MIKLVAGWAGVLVALGLATTPAPAFADFSIQKAKPKAKSAPQRPARARRPRVTEEEPAPPPAPAVTGIDPALMQQAVAEANYSAKLVRDPGGQTAVIEVTDGKTGWTVNFKNCVDDSHCGFMELYTLWPVSNEANVCTVWSLDVTKDPSRNLGKPYCYTVPQLTGQLHLKLSSDQGPYLGMDKLTPEQAKERMQGMIGVWQSYLPQLQEAWKIASTKCPRAAMKCDAPAAGRATTTRSHR